MKIKAVVIPGHGVASGQGNDPRYPEGTLKAQYEHFQKRGLDLLQYFTGTVNVDISPYSFRIRQPKYFFENIQWSDHIPPENFYFFDVALQFNGEVYEGLIYMPDPATKEDHFQEPTTLELLLPKIDNVSYGDSVLINVKEEQLELVEATTS